jgi:hypothetical protein
MNERIHERILKYLLLLQESLKESLDLAFFRGDMLQSRLSTSIETCEFAKSQALRAVGDVESMQGAARLREKSLVGENRRLQSKLSKTQVALKTVYEEYKEAKTAKHLRAASAAASFRRAAACAQGMQRLGEPPSSSLRAPTPRESGSSSRQQLLIPPLSTSPTSSSRPGKILYNLTQYLLKYRSSITTVLLIWYIPEISDLI